MTLQQRCFDMGERIHCLEHAYKAARLEALVDDMAFSTLTDHILLHFEPSSALANSPSYSGSCL
jgi:hypothetical protein